MSLLPFGFLYLGRTKLEMGIKPFVRFLKIGFVVRELVVKSLFWGSKTFGKSLFFSSDDFGSNPDPLLHLQTSHHPSLLSPPLPSISVLEFNVNPGDSRMPTWWSWSLFKHLIFEVLHFALLGIVFSSLSISLQSSHFLIQNRRTASSLTCPRPRIALHDLHNQDYMIVYAVGRVMNDSLAVNFPGIQASGDSRGWGRRPPIMYLTPRFGEQPISQSICSASPIASGHGLETGQI